MIVDMIAKFAGRCDKCKLALDKGVRVYYHTEKKRIKCHPSCPEKVEPPKVAVLPRGNTMELIIKWRELEKTLENLDEEVPF